MNTTIRLYTLVIVICSSITIFAQHSIEVQGLPITGTVDTFINQLDKCGKIGAPNIDGDSPVSYYDDFCAFNTELAGKVVIMGIKFTPISRLMYNVYYLDYNRNIETAHKRHKLLGNTLNKKYGQPVSVKNDGSKQKIWNIRYLDKKGHSAILGKVKLELIDKSGKGNTCVFLEYSYNEEFDPRYIM